MRLSCFLSQHSLPIKSIFTKKFHTLLFNLGKKFSAQITHAKFIKTCENPNHILNLYTKSNLFHYAHKLFGEMPHRDVQSWTIAISGFSNNGDPKTALNFFSKMVEQGCVPNQFTFSIILKCCSSLNDLYMGMQIHGFIIRNEVVLDVVLGNSVLDMYVKCGVFGYAKKVFRLLGENIDTVSTNIMIGGYVNEGEMEESMKLFRRVRFKDVSTWNTIIDGHIRNGSERIAIDLLYEMVKIGPEFDKLTFSIALVLGSSLSMLGLGREIHCRVLKMGIHYDGFIANSLIDLYCKCREMDKALAVLENIRRNADKSVVGSVFSGSIIKGYFESGRLEDAIKLLNSIIRRNNEVDIFTLTSVVSMSGYAGILELGQQIHCRIIKHGQELSDIGLASSMIDMYARCGRLDDALLIFGLTTHRNVVLWTSMINSCASHGQGKRAIELFELMLNEGIRPNEITFVAVLTACSHTGLLREGCEYFALMKEAYNIKPVVEHYTCMVDLFGRSGRLNMIKEFIYENSITHVSAVWKAFLSSCRVHKNVEMANWVSERLLELEPLEAEPYILLSNTCATDSRWEEAAKLRELMKKREITKSPGQSWILS